MVRLLLRIAVTVSIVNLAGIGAISLGDVSPALAGGAPPTNCADTSPPSGSTVDGNLIVKGKNGFCDLVDVHVTGNVTVYAGDSLVTDGVTQIGGKLTSRGGQFIQICESDIQGNVKITGTVSGEFGGIEIGGVDCGASGGSDIFGSLTVEKNSAPGINIVGNTVGNGSGHGSITVSNNVAVAGSTDKVSDNMFYGKLKCVGNNPPPTGLGNSNPAHLPGVGTGQCAGLIV
jgi:hypothetical protein